MLKGTAYRWLDLDMFCRQLLPRDRVHRIRYFTALVSGRSGDPQQPQRQQTYLRALRTLLRALRTLPRLSVHLGHYLSHPVRMPLAHPSSAGPQTVEVIRTEEKGSDVNLASYLLLDGFRGDCESAVVISNDSDLKVPIELAQKELGLVVGVVNPHPPARRSRALRPTFWRQVRESQLRSSQFPPVMTDAKGTIRKPPGW
jgi:hypothetical protein